MSMKLECYRCGSTHQLMIQEKIDNETNNVIEKKFVCIRCVGSVIENVKVKEDMK